MNFMRLIENSYHHVITVLLPMYSLNGTSSCCNKFIPREEVLDAIVETAFLKNNFFEKQEFPLGFWVYRSTRKKTTPTNSQPALQERSLTPSWQ